MTKNEAKKRAFDNIEDITAAYADLAAKRSALTSIARAVAKYKPEGKALELIELIAASMMA